MLDDARMQKLELMPLMSKSLKKQKSRGILYPQLESSIWAQIDDSVRSESGCLRTNSERILHNSKIGHFLYL